MPLEISVRDFAKRKGIELKEEFSPESLFAFVNIQSTQVNRAISNIMNNAAQAFDGKPGNVILKLRSDNESVYISICDNGKGMTPEMGEKIKNNITGKFETSDKGEDTDMWALENKFVSVVPTQFDMTAHHLISQLNDWEF